jgi:hypothetical protein
MTRLEQWLRRNFAHKEIGWQEIDEKFTRYTLLKTRWLTVYLHQLDAAIAHPSCHDHPWSFWAFILRGGYWESHDGRPFVWRGVGSVLYRHARFTHNVVTPRGVTNWSVCVVSQKIRDWGFKCCRVGSQAPLEG